MDDSLKELVRCLAEAKSLRSDLDRRAFVVRHTRSACFVNLVQRSCSPLHWYGPLAGDEDVPLRTVDFEKVTLVGVLSMLEADRALSTGTSAAIRSGYLKAHPDHAELLDGVIAKNLFGLSADLVNECAGFGWVPVVRTPDPVRFRDDLFANASDWFSCSRAEGSLATVVKYGASCEVLSKSGRQYVMLDSLRKAFSRIPYDGLLTVQLSFVDEGGTASMKKFFSETARKDQSEAWRATVVDYRPIPASGKVPDAATWEERRPLALLAARFAADDRVSYCDAVQCGSVPDDGRLLVRRTSTASDKCSKDFLFK